MPFRIKCPTGHSLVVPDSLAGKTVRCPRCQQTVVIPTLDKPALEREIVPPVIQAAVPPVEPPVVLKTVPEPVPKPAAKPILKLPAATVEPVKTVEPVQPAEPVNQLKPPTTPSTPPPAPPPPPALLPPVIAAVEVVPETAAAAVAVAVASPTVKDLEVSPTPPLPPPLPPPSLPPIALMAPAAAEVTTAVTSLAAPASIEPVPAEPTPREPTATVPPPLTHHASQLLGVYHLAIAVAGMALFSMVPGLWDVWEYWQNPDEMFIARWALVVLTIGLVQLAYAAFLWHLADWTSVWVVTMVALATAALYAMMLGITLVAGNESQLVDSLQLNDRLIHKKAELWCLCMISLATILAFFSGRMASRWQRSEAMLRAAGL